MLYSPNESISPNVCLELCEQLPLLTNHAYQIYHIHIENSSSSRDQRGERHHTICLILWIFQISISIFWSAIFLYYFVHCICLLSLCYRVPCAILFLSPRDIDLTSAILTDRGLLVCGIASPLWERICLQPLRLRVAFSLRRMREIEWTVIQTIVHISTVWMRCNW